MTFDLKSPDVLRRLAVTLGALCVWLIALYIPLHGIDQVATASVMGGMPRSLARLSIGALSVVPIVSALTLAEAVRLIGPRFLTEPRSDMAPWWVLWLALAFAVVQAANVAVALEQAGSSSHPLVPQPGPMFRIVCVATLTASTALFWWLATEITRHGLGSGVWLLFAALPIADLAPAVPMVVQLLRTGAMSAYALLPLASYTVLSIAAVVFLYRILPSADRGEALLWPPLLAPLAIGLALFALTFVSISMSTDLVSPILSYAAPGHPAWIVVSSTLICLFVFLHQRRSSHPLSRGQSVLIAATLVAITVAGSLLGSTGATGAIATDGGLLVIATLVALKIAEAARGAGR